LDRVIVVMRIADNPTAARGIPIVVGADANTGQYLERRGTAAIAVFEGALVITNYQSATALRATKSHCDGTTVRIHFHDRGERRCLDLYGAGRG
jgi:hypothetical protein